MPVRGPQSLRVLSIWGTEPFEYKALLSRFLAFSNTPHCSGTLQVLRFRPHFVNLRLPVLLYGCNHTRRACRCTEIHADHCPRGYLSLQSNSRNHGSNSFDSYRSTSSCDSLIQLQLPKILKAASGTHVGVPEHMRTAVSASVHIRGATPAVADQICLIRMGR